MNSPSKLQTLLLKPGMSCLVAVGRCQPSFQSTIEGRIFAFAKKKLASYLNLSNLLSPESKTKECANFKFEVKCSVK